MIDPFVTVGLCFGYEFVSLFRGLPQFDATLVGFMGYCGVGNR